MAKRKEPTHVDQWHGQKTWHAAHKDELTLGQRFADAIAKGMGSWKFIIAQTIFVIVWMLLNIYAIVFGRWDPYPFILLNLLFSTQAAYAAPIIMMSQNRSGERDRFQAEEDFRTNVESKKDIEAVQRQLSHMEVEKLDKLIELAGNDKLDRILALLEALPAG